MNKKISDYSENKEAQGNFNYHLGQLCSAINKEQDAKNYFSEAKRCFSGAIDPKHPVFELIEEYLKRIKLGT